LRIARRMAPREESADSASSEPLKLARQVLKTKQVVLIEFAESVFNALNVRRAHLKYHRYRCGRQAIRRRLLNEQSRPEAQGILLGC
jgi:hypothetical protein